jgi:DsbC/DsbD-like thiol-disulfide interchange protein
VITELGLLDRDLQAHHAAFGIQTKEHQLGVAYPVIFAVDEAGRVVDKRIGENYRVREGALKLVEEALGVILAPAGPQGTAAAGHIKVAAVTDSAEYVRWQETRLHVVIDVDPGWHIYGRPIPDGYQALTVELEGIPEVEVRPAQYPLARPFVVEGLDEQFHVYEGRVQVVVPFAVRVPPGHGAIDLKIVLQYQVCSETECLPPDRMELKLQLDEAAAAA